MASSLGVLTIDLVAKIGGFVEGLSKAERSSKKFADDTAKNLKRAGLAFTALAAGVYTATAALVKSSIDNADALLAQSQMYGVNIELLSGYQLGLEKSESSSADLATGLKGLANAVDSDSEAFKRLQISTKDADGALKSSNALLEEISDRFASMPDGITKTALAQDLLGKSGINLIPFLNQGAAGLRAFREEAEKFGNVISLETAIAADEFNDNLANLKGVIKGAGNELAEALLPQLIEFTDTINDPATQQGIKELVQEMANFAIQITELAAALPSIGRFIQDALGFDTSDFLGLNEQLAETQEKIDKLKAPNKGNLNINEAIRLNDLYTKKALLLRDIKNIEQEYLKAQEARLKGSGDTAGLSAPAATFTPLPADSTEDAAEAQKEWNKAMEKALDDAEKTMAKLQAIDDERASLNAGMERELALYGETSQAVILRYDIEHGKLAALNEENKAYSIALAEQLDAKKALAEEAANDEQFVVMEAGLQKQIDLLGNVSEAAELLYDIEHGGYKQFDEDQQAKLVLLAEELEARESMMREIEEQEKAKAKIMEEFADRTQNILADFLKGSFDDGFKGVVDRFKQMLADMAAEAVAADIMKFVIGLGKNSGGTSNGWGKAISAFAGFFDGGGMIPAGQWGIAGENGAEIIRGPANITSTKDTAAMLAKGGNTNNVTFVFPGVTNKQEAQQAGSAAARQFNRMGGGSSRYN
jgi:hypothetical protein